MSCSGVAWSYQGEGPVGVRTLSKKILIYNNHLRTVIFNNKYETMRIKERKNSGFALGVGGSVYSR